MAEHIINWFVDTLARTETLDLYFIITDLIDIPKRLVEMWTNGELSMNGLSGLYNPTNQAIVADHNERGESLGDKVY